LPLIVTIGDSDLRAMVRSRPESAAQVYSQSVAEDILRQREEALSRIHQLGGLALDVPAGRPSFEFVNKYLGVKDRGLLGSRSKAGTLARWNVDRRASISCWRWSWGRRDSAACGRSPPTPL